MKKITLDSVLKIILVSSFVYLSFALSRVSDKLENGRYEYNSSGITSFVFDTRTGKKYRYQDGKLTQRKY